MERFIPIILITLFTAYFANAQNNIVKGNGICYTNGVPTVTINTDYHCEFAIDTSTGKIYVYGRDTAGGKWIHYGWPLRETGATGSPSYTPGDKQSFFAVNLGDSLYFYGGGSWGLVSGGGGSDGNGIYDGSGTVPDLTYAKIGNNSLNTNRFSLGYLRDATDPTASPISARGYFLDDNGLVHLINSDSTELASARISLDRSNINIIADGASNQSIIQLDTTFISMQNGGALIQMIGDDNQISSDSLYLSITGGTFEINSSKGSSGQVLKSNGYSFDWANEGDGSTTNEIQSLTATAGKGTLRLDLGGGSVVLNDSSSVNEGDIDWSVTANEASIISNTLGSETIYMAGRNGLVISDSSGYMLFTQASGGSGISSNVLSLSGNTMTSNINSGSYSDTSLVIGEVNGNLSGNTQTINVNDVTDTMAVIGSNVLTFTSDSIKSTINGINSNAIYLGGYTNTDTQDLSITAGKGTINLVDGGNVTLNDSSSTNEGIVSFTVSANTGTLLSNTFGQQPYYFGGRGILQLTDSSGYTLLTATEGDGSTTNEGLLSWNVSANLMTLTSNTSGSETLLAAGRSGITLTDSSGYLIFTGSAAGSTDTTYFHHQYGNSYGKVSTIGTNDNYGVNIETNNINRVHIDTSGVMSVGTTTPVAIGNATMTPAADYTFGNGAYGLTLNSTKNSASAILINTTGQDANSTCFGMSNFTSTTINKAVVNFMDTVTVASGTIFFDAIEINNVFNVTGGSAIGSFTGLHINPSFTSLAGLSSTYYGVYIPYTNANAKGIWQTGALTENLFAGQTQFSKQIKSKEISAPSTPPSTFGYWYVSSSDSKPHFITDGGTDYDLTAGGGVSTNTLSLSGNSMTSNVDGVSDTSLVIGEVYTNLSGNTLTTEINNISDTSLIIGVHTVNLSGNQITSNTNGVSDTTLVIGTVNGNLASNTITLNVNSVTDTVLVIGRNTLNLSGNEITTNVNGVTDTTLVIGTVSNTSSTNSLSTTVNGITGSTVNIINSNTLSFGTVTGILTSNINGVSDTTLISAVVGDGDKGDITISSGVWDIDASTVGTSEITDGSIANGDLASGVGGIYKGSGDVAAGAYANTGSISSTDNFFLGSYHSQPTVNYDGREYGLQVYSGGNVGIAELNGADSIAATYSKLSLNGDVSLLASNVANTAQSYVSLFSAGYFEAGHTLSGNTGTIRIAGYDSTKIISKKLSITVDSFRLKLLGAYGTSGQFVKVGSNGLLEFGSGGAATLNLSYDVANHEVDIDGGGTSAVIPLAVADGATEGVASFSATYFDASSGNITPDLTNGLASGSQGGWLSSTNWTTFNSKANKSIYADDGRIDSTRYAQIDPDSAFFMGYFPDAATQTINFDGREIGISFQNELMTIHGRDSALQIWSALAMDEKPTLQLANAALSKRVYLALDTTYFRLHIEHGSDESNIYGYKDSIEVTSKKLFVSVDSFRMKLQGSFGTSGQFVKVGANGLLTFGTGGGGASTNVLSYGTVTGILTSVVDGISDTTAIPLAAADGATMGIASFTAADFNSSAGNISIDYTNGQAASGSNKGFLTSADWTTFNNKLSAVTYANVTSGSIPDNTLVQALRSRNVAWGYFQNFPSGVNDEDRGIWMDDEVYIYANDSTSGNITRIYSDNGSWLMKVSNGSPNSYLQQTLTKNEFYIDDGTDNTLAFFGSDSIYLRTDRVRVETDSFKMVLSGSSGTNGQVLKSNGSVLYWAADATGGGGLSDGDYGDITVGGSGTTMTVDNDAITSAKIAANTINQTDVDDDFIFINGGNITGNVMSVGTNDAFDFSLKANATNMLTVKSAGGIAIGGGSGATSTAYDWLTFNHTTSGTVAAGFGTNILFNLESSTTDNQPAANIAAVWSDPTHATRKGDLVFSTVNSSSTLNENLRIAGDMSKTFTASVSNTNTVFDQLVLKTNSTGTAAASFGSGILFQGESSTTDNVEMCRLRTYWTTATHATNEAAFSIMLADAGGALTEKFKFDAVLSGSGVLSIGSASTLTISNSAFTTAASYTVGNSSSALTLGGSSGTVTLSSASSSSQAILINPAHNTGSLTIGTGSYTFTTGTKNMTAFSSGYAPTSGTGVHNQLIFDGTYNQTGGANGITRNIYLNPTLTAVADFRGIDIAYSNASAKGIYQSGALTKNVFVGHTTFGGTGTPMAQVQFTAGTTSANSQPICFVAGPNTSTAVKGEMNYDSSYYLTKESALRFGVGGTIKNFYSDAANSGTSETDLYSYTTPANTLGRVGETIEADFYGQNVHASATMGVRVYFAGTQIHDYNAAGVQDWTVHVCIVRTGSTTARAAVTFTSKSNTSKTTYTSLTGLTLSNTNILKITGQSTVGSNDVVATIGAIKWYPGDKP